jgi:uracil-DNA glycosylase family 4
MTFALPLYPTPPAAPIESTTPALPSADCKACELHAGVRSVCIKADGTPGGLLVLVDSPQKIDDSVGRPMVGPTGKYIRNLIAKHWKGPVVYDTAVRCSPGAEEVTAKHVEACASYTARVLQDARPSRVLVFGSWAALAVLGRKPQAASVRRGYGWVRVPTFTGAGSQLVPVFIGQHPALAMRNRFIAKQFEFDLKHVLTTTPVPVPFSSAVREHITTREQALRVLAALREASRVIVDTETSGVMFESDFRVETVTAWPMHDGEAGLVGYTWDRSLAGSFTDAVLGPLRTALADPRIPWIGHNLKFDAHAVRLDPDIHTTIANKHGDTRLWRKMLEGTVISAALDTASEIVGVGGHKDESKAALDPILTDLAKLAGEPNRAPLKSGKPRKLYECKVLRREAVTDSMLDKIRTGAADAKGFAFHFMAPDVRTRYNARDCFTTALLTEKLEPELAANDGLSRVWEEITKPTMYALERMEARGMCIDIQALNAFDGFLGVKLAMLDASMRVYAGPEFNFNSTLQLRTLLFEKLGLPRVKLTDTGADSTDGEVLEELRDKHPMVADLCEYRRLSKLKSQYAAGMIPYVREDGRIHASVLQDGTDTGRCSCKAPNLFNLPRPKDEHGNMEGKLARDIFISPPGYSLLEADQSQVELRGAAFVSGDPVMIDLFRRGVDMHDATAGMICTIAWGISPERWAAMSKEERSPFRSKAKTVVFGLLYGKTAYALAHDLGCTTAEAERIVAAVLGKFKRLNAWIESQHASAQKLGGVMVPWRNLPGIWRQLNGIGEYGDQAKYIRQNAINASVNTPIQGWASWVTTASLWPIQQEFDAEGLDAHIVLSVYDSVMCEVRNDHIVEAARIMQRIMTSWESGDVPLVVDFKLGTAWGSLAEYKLAA